MQSKRLFVIENGIKIEKMISRYLCYSLDVPESSSRLFGEKATALSFNAKIDLLLEVDYFDITLKDKFSKFAEIRNKFAHLESVHNYTTCFSRIEGIVNKLKKWYPLVNEEEYDELEKYYSALYFILFSEVLGDINRFIEFLTNKIHKDYKLKFEARFFRHYSQLLDFKAETNSELFEILKNAWQQTIEETASMPDFSKSKYMLDTERKNEDK